jgi:hypothetical protein
MPVQSNTLIFYFGRTVPLNKKISKVLDKVWKGDLGSEIFWFGQKFAKIYMLGLMSIGVFSYKANILEVFS